MTLPGTPQLLPAQPERRVWDFWPTIGFSAVILATYFAAQVIVSFTIFAMRLRSSGLSFTDALAKLATEGFTLSVAIMISVALGSLLVFVFIRLKGRISVSDYLGFHRLQWRTILLLILLFAVMLAVTLVIGSYAGDQQDSEFNTELYRTSIFPPLLWLAVMFVGPFFEEVFFRGFLFVGLRASRVGVIATIIVTSLLWAALHVQYNLFGITQILLMGLVLGTVRHKTDSLWSSLLIHVLWNGAAMVATAIYVTWGGA